MKDQILLHSRRAVAYLPFHENLENSEIEEAECLVVDGCVVGELVVGVAAEAVVGEIGGSEGKEEDFGKG